MIRLKSMISTRLFGVFASTAMLAGFVNLGGCATKRPPSPSMGEMGSPSSTVNAEVSKGEAAAAEKANAAMAQASSHDGHGHAAGAHGAADHGAAAAGQHATAHQSSGHGDHAATHSGPPGEKEMKWLKNGNSRFTRNVLRNDFKTLVAKKALLKKLSGGQSPHTIVLSCSDSRVPPELVFDQVMGEIFVIRVAGQALDSSVIASIEYAAEHLGSQLLLVMGHEACGAVKAAISTPVGTSAGSESLDKLVADIRPRIEQSIRNPMVSDVLVESWANTKGIAKELLARSSILSHRVAEGKLKVSSALYRFGSGVVEFE